MSIDSTEGPEMPCAPLPWLNAFWLTLPPMVATRPGNGPQNGVRRPCSASFVRSAAQVAPGPQVTTAFGTSISIESSAPRSNSAWPPGA